MSKYRMPPHVVNDAKGELARATSTEPWAPENGRPHVPVPAEVGTGKAAVLEIA